MPPCVSRIDLGASSAPLDVLSARRRPPGTHTDVPGAHDALVLGSSDVDEQQEAASMLALVPAMLAPQECAEPLVAACRAADAPLELHCARQRTRLLRSMLHSAEDEAKSPRAVAEPLMQAFTKKSKLFGKRCLQSCAVIALNECQRARGSPHFTAERCCRFLDLRM